MKITHNLTLSYFLDPCFPNLCLNSGICSKDGIGGYKCNCTGTGFYGPTCAGGNVTVYHILIGSTSISTTCYSRLWLFC